MQRLAAAAFTVLAVSIDQQLGPGFAVRMAFALEKDPAELERQTRVSLRLVTVTLTWLVMVPLLVIFGLTATHTGGAFSAAAVLVLLLPFIAAVIATQARRFSLGGLYTVLTLLMVIPALACLRAS